MAEPAGRSAAIGPTEPGDRAAIDVSVVLPAHNEELYVEAALGSILGQTWPLGRIEAIVVANGSTDRTNRVVRAFAEAHPELAVRLIADPVRGIARSKNRGARIARGELLLFFDAASRMAPDLVGRVIERARAGQPAGDIRLVADSADPLDRAFFGLIEFGKRLFSIRANMLYCARDLFERFGGFDERLRHAEDRDLLLRLQRAGIAVGHLDESFIATSPRRLRRLPFRLGTLTTLGRWTLGHLGIGRRWPY